MNSWDPAKEEAGGDSWIECVSIPPVSPVISAL